jgi:acid stress chaperone HdeB
MLGLLDFHANGGYPVMRIIGTAALLTALLAASPVLADDQTIDLGSATCKDFIDSGKDGIQMIGTWLDAYYLKSNAKPIINVTRLVNNMQALGKACADDGSTPLMKAADKVMGK